MSSTSSLSRVRRFFSAAALGGLVMFRTVEARLTAGVGVSKGTVAREAARLRARRAA